MMHYELIAFFFAVAFIYASVGFGGGSSYLALLALYALPFQEMKLTALTCNIIVVTGGTLIYLRRKELPIRRVIPLALASVPMAFIGAALRISQHTFFLVLGCCLLIAGILLWIKPPERKPLQREEMKAGTACCRRCCWAAALAFFQAWWASAAASFFRPYLTCSIGTHLSALPLLRVSLYW